jgi:hypothetical protein
MRKASCWLLWMCLVGWAWGQQASSNPGTVPTVIRFSGNLADANGKPLSGVVGVTFSLFKDEQGGAPLWVETQNVQPDRTGLYSVMLGSTSSTGLPTGMFVAGEARWVGVQAQGQAEQRRVLLVSVPYALKAADAQTIGGLPPSAFVLAAPQNGGTSGGGSGPASGQGAPPPSSDITGSGTVNYVPLWDSASDIVSSVVFQSGAGSKAKIGIGTAKPASTLDVKGGSTIRGLFSLPASGTATASAGFNSQPMNLAASVFNSGTSTAVPQIFQWKAEPVGNDTSNATGSLNLLFAQGTGKQAETGLNIASNGQITFAEGQTFPGTGNGTVTSVGSGPGLTGGPITTSGTLSIATGGVGNAMLANPALTVSAGTDLTGGGLVALGGSTTLNLDTTQVPQLNTANSFTGNQSITGNLAATGLISGGAGDFSGLVTEAGALLPASGTATTGQGYNSQPLDSVTSAYNSGTASAQNQDFQWLAEPVGNNTSSPSGKLDLLFGANGATPTETGLSVASNGQITFATGQTFPGNGTVTSVGSGPGLTGGPITTSGTLSIATGGVSNAMLANPSLTVTAGTDLTGGGAIALGGSTTINLDTSRVPQLNAANTFNASQTVNGNLSATGVVTGSGYQIGSNLFAFGSYGNANASLGFAGNSTMTGYYNTASGAYALSGNQSGYYNTASGAYALSGNQSGGNNTASGAYALYSNTSGGANTANGYSALVGNTTGSYNTASGWAALENNGNGTANTANGYEALAANSGGACCNTASGYQALKFNGGGTNTASGYQALYHNTGNSNTADGVFALFSNQNGYNNTADGYHALFSNSTGYENTAVGVNSADNETTSHGLACVGYNTCGGSHNLHNAGAFGTRATVEVSDAIVLGSVAGVNGATTTVRVGIGTTKPTNLLTLGQGGGLSISDGWATYSSRRWKTNIQPLHNALRMVEQLRGVSYELKDSGKHEIGVIAEEVGAVVPEVVTYEENGKDARGVDYSRLTALLIEAVKQQQRQIRQQQAVLRTQASAILDLKSELRITRQTLQKVQAQVAATQPALVATK